MTSNPTSEKKTPLAYHLASDHYGQGVCGTHGMMAVNLTDVTCVRCKRNAKFKAMANIATRYAGVRA